MNEFRRDPVTGRWVVIASSRDARPNHYRGQVIRESDDGRETCPFCAHQLDTPRPIATYGVSADAPWQVCVVPNRYPILHPDSPPDPPRAAAGLFDVAGDWGFHEVIIESSTHVTLASELSREQIVWMLTAYRDRMRVVRDAGMCFGLTMKNSGADAGASLKHAHSQLFGLPFVPPQMQLELQGSRQFYEVHERCVFCALIEAERSATARIVAENDGFLAWCPYASRFAYETWIAPKAHHAQFEEETDSTLESLGEFFRLILRRIDAHPRIGAFNYLIHSLPFDTKQHDHYHWHIEIIPRVAKAAGFEWGTGVHINAVIPAVAAEQLRNVATGP